MPRTGLPKAPPGKEFVEVATGRWELRDRPPRKQTKTIAFRASDEIYLKAWSLVETFPSHEWGEAMRWLLEQPEVTELVKQRRRDAARTRKKT